MNIDKEFQALIPPLTTEEYAGLEQSIISEGCRDALIVWNDTLIDGHNRYQICSKHDISFKTSEKIFRSRDDAMLWIIDNQFNRRNLPPYDRGILVLRKKDILSRQAKEKKLTTLKQNITVPQIFGERENADKKENETNVKIGKEAGLSHETIRKIERIEQKAAPEVKAKIKTGEVSINQAYQTVKREEKIKAVEEKVETHKEKPTGSIDIYNTDNKYNIIYADPAWDYWSGGQKNQSLHYKTMTIEEICNLPIKNIADKDCILFLWVTFPILQECFKVIESWEFKYSTCGFNWIKKNKSSENNFFGCGAWTRANSELCLIATKGTITRLDASISQIIESPIEEHSKKPDIVRELITKMVGELPRIELFSRRPTDGWDVWGNEI